jgi:hypothetical protein
LPLPISIETSDLEAKELLCAPTDYRSNSLGQLSVT